MADFSCLTVVLMIFLISLNEIASAPGEDSKEGGMALGGSRVTVEYLDRQTGTDAVCNQKVRLLMSGVVVFDDISTKCIRSSGVDTSRGRYDPGAIVYNEELKSIVIVSPQNKCSWYKIEGGEIKSPKVLPETSCVNIRQTIEDENPSS